ncbi:hypothetical protein ABZY06_23345 [Streptomyces sp. NPDC006540]
MHTPGLAVRLTRTRDQAVLVGSMGKPATLDVLGVFVRETKIRAPSE